MSFEVKNDIIEVVKGRYQRPSTDAINLLLVGEGDRIIPLFASPCLQYNGGFIMPGKRGPIALRFWSKVDKSGGPDACWPWTACRDKDGYGEFGVTTEPRKHHNERAHRMAYELTYGPIPEGLKGLHKCDNPPCCNPNMFTPVPIVTT